MRLQVEVTQEDIDNGTTECAGCPIALATTRALAAAGFPKCCAEWEPYRAFSKPTGLSIYDTEPVRRTLVLAVPVEDCPDEMYDFARHFDDWYELAHSYDGDAALYEEETGHHDPETEPPAPLGFTIELALA
jgi:hypothetical protein